MSRDSRPRESLFSAWDHGPHRGPGPAFSVGVAVGKRLAANLRDNVAVVLPPWENPSVAAAALTEGLIVGTKSPGLWKTEPNRHPFRVLQIAISPEDAGDLAKIRHAVAQGADRGRLGQHGAWNS